MSTMYRQGDILIRLVADTPPRWVSIWDEVPREDGRVVVAYGEATGHAHAIAESGAHQYLVDDKRHLVVDEGTNAVLTHDEHNPITLGPGFYTIHEQREYSPSGIYRVSD